MIWFAAGALVVVLSLLLSTWFAGKFQTPRQAYVVFSSPHIEIEDPKVISASENQDENNLSQRLGEQIKSCGFSQFEIALSVEDLQYFVPISPETEKSLQCVFRSLEGAEHVESIEFKAVMNAQTH
ncbi:MAG: hypothetical protein EOP84_37155 [Verrucomicrobiaceae bacterium]|nr:MAG: hypothetical protein EOP84_37155 [Verrucomicrobiaceae bacterium]